MGTTAREKGLPTADDAPLSPVNTRPGPSPTDKTTPNSLQRTSSWQSSASAGSSTSGVGSSSRTVSVPKPHSTAVIQTHVDEVDTTPSRGPAREPRRRPTPGGQTEKHGHRSQSTPADRLKPTQQMPAATNPSRNGVVSGHAATPSTQHHVDRSLGSTESPLSAFVDRTGLVLDVRSKTAYRRGRLLGKVLSQRSLFFLDPV